MAASREDFLQAAPELDALAALALDALRDPVLIVECDLPQFPVLLANAAARSLLQSGAPGRKLSTVHELIAPQSYADLGHLLADLADSKSTASRNLVWRLPGAEVTRITESRLLLRPGKARLMMLMLAASTPSDWHLMMLTKTSPNVLSVVSNDGKDHYVGDGMHRVLGYSLADRLASVRYDLVHPYDLDRARVAFEKVASGRVERLTHEIRVRHKNGSYRWLETTMISAVDDPEIQGVVVHARDISERKRAINFFAQTQRAARTGGWEYDPETKQLYWSEELYRIFETLPDEFKPTIRGVLARVSAPSRRRLRELRSANLSLSQPIEIEIQINTFKGNRLWVRLVINTERSDGTPGRSFGAVQNIQEEKQARLTFERSAEWLKLSMNLSQMHAWRWERDTDVFEFIGPEQNVELLPRRIRGMDSFLIRTHPDDRLRLTQAIEQGLAGGTGLKQEFRWKLRGSDYRWYVVAAVAMYDGNKNVSGFVGATQDITDRKHLEREILEIANREQQRIGHDLHDGLGQELTGIALMLRALATQIRRESPSAVAHVNEIVALVNQSIESAHSLARGLSPVSANRGGLIYALRALAARSRDQYGIEVRFRSRVWPQLTIDEAGTGHLYRIAQEALANATKHGRASKVSIQLRVNANTFALSIEDDGIGLGGMPVQAGGMGLKIMAYRASMIGAMLEFLPNVPSGTIVRITGDQPAQG